MTESKGAAVSTERQSAEQDHASAAWHEADSGARESREACAMAGLTLPSLSTDLTALMSGLPLVDLGRVNSDTALKLAEVIRRGRS
ncbi:hypothetical protein AB0G54_07715 [Streptomyces yokosukanensis]|uniref:hypothetical protein n=1 Tax=Streptomyces yokosukanensis TaxID=67386 RepID=UPI003414CE81